jgi:osmotically-inducible protein OsmY
LKGEEVKMPLQSTEVRTRVLNALHWDLAVPRDRLNVDVEDGWVTVSGIVDLPYQKTCAESDARNVPGVVGVTNLIRLAVAGQTKPEAEETPQGRH